MMLKAIGLEQYYGGSHTLWDLSIEVPKGACVCVMGRNGVGKTTLLRAIMGIVPLRSGRIVFDDFDLAPLPIFARARRGIGYVPQGRDIFPQLTVEENLRLPLGTTKKKAIPERIFSLFPVLAEMRHRRGGDLSGGQQQQLSIGRALVLEPKLLVLDEPTEGIQPNIVSDIGDILLKLNREDGLTLLVVEQKLHFARKIADSFSILDRGRVVASGKRGELTDELVARHLTV